MTQHEYRVRWRREERDVTQIFQTRGGACGKIERLLALEEVKADLPSYQTMPDLVGEPVLEVRDVGEWRAHPDQPGLSKETRSEWRATVHKEQELRDGTSTAVVLYEPLAVDDIPF